ncbi:T9SS type A sorting domain-containing protein [Mangrovivirga cuniculi]|uniref:Secretion system C-terminal sorting domain-containing protein n=1 Tax=Mangrovivirga cuniculi TaxID=2715131 RepID=A0A4D7K699_9BACT|nr:hypothetical protein DCC35_09390 [Mangrovivirga cuniculi]
MKIYPNPSKEYIKLSKSVYNWSIYNIKGQLILENDKYVKGNYINLHNLPEGLYIFKGYDNNKKPFQLKFIIQ